MTTLADFSTGLSRALGVPPSEVKAVARWQRKAGRHPTGPSARSRHIAAIDGARLLVGVMVMRIEGAATPAASVTADIERLAGLRHGAELYFDTDFVLPNDFIGAVAEILAALADHTRRRRAQEWIERIGLARGAGRMAGWIQLRTPEAEQCEDFDYAASPADLMTIVDAAPVVRRIEVRLPALVSLAELLTTEPAKPATEFARSGHEP